MSMLGIIPEVRMIGCPVLTVSRMRTRMIQGSGFRVQGSGFRVQGSGFRVQGSGFGVQGLGFRVRV